MGNELQFHRILRPNRSMSFEGQEMVAYILLGLLMILVPAIFVTGFWGLYFVLFAPVVLIVLAFILHNRNMRLYEELTITRERLDLRHVKPNGRVLEFHTDPHWVKIEMQAEGGPVENYLTLRDQNRHVELGRFLAPEQRKELYGELRNFKSRL